MATGLWTVLLAAGSAPAAHTVSSIGGVELPKGLQTTEIRCANGAIATAAPEASEAGAAILRAGGNAVDAAVAAAFVLGVVGPCTSGLGGATYILIHTAGGRTIAIDGSAPAPANLDLRALQQIRNEDERVSPKIAGVPGTVAALVHALQRYGSKSLPEVITPAWELARFGCRISPEQASTITDRAPLFRLSPPLAQVFLDPNLEPWPADHLYCQDDLASTLERIAVGGAREFYRGSIAQEINDDMVQNGGYIRRLDLMRARAKERTPIRGRYRGYDIVAFPSPGGGASVIEALQILEHFPPELLTNPGVDRMYLLTEAVRMALIDGYAGNEATEIRQFRQIDPARAAELAGLLDFDRSVPDKKVLDAGPSPWIMRGTTQVSVVDGHGNVVSLTQTLGHNTGARIATPGLGFIYNSFVGQLEYRDPSSPAFATQDRVASTTMAPTIVFLRGKPVVALGGAGSARITSTIVDVIVNMVDGGMTVGEAVAAPRIIWRDDEQTLLFIENVLPNTEEDAYALLCRGYPDLFMMHFPARPIDLRAFGGVNAVAIEAGTGMAVGAGDPRRFGIAASPCEP